jgi:UDP-N-acetylmuramyl pentapeptide phosphotransferase/UDP-N-acetylglucosamine-1-phosphate transferase
MPWVQELGLDQAGAWRGGRLNVFWLALTFLLSILIVGISRKFLIDMHMFDHPGKRRLHIVPIPRGGGLAIAVSVLISTGIVSVITRRSDLVCFLAGLILVAGIGWWDDRRSLGIAARLIVHAIAGIMVLLLLGQLGFIAPANVSVLLVLATAVMICVVASINLHNFIDGANGMLSAQSLFVFGTLAALVVGSDPLLGTVIFCCGGAVLGFLPWNFPQARIFMGDIGSGTLGYLLAAVTLWAWAIGAITLIQALLLHSLVLIDGLCTLSFRICSGRRWWQGHREHLYQWLVRSGRSHARVVMALQIWNLAAVLPLILWLHWRHQGAPELVGFNSGLHDPLAGVVLVAVFAGGVSLWWYGKSRLLGAYRAKYRHEK